MDALIRLKRTIDYLLALAGSAKDGPIQTSPGSLYAAVADLATVAAVLATAPQASQPQAPQGQNPAGGIAGDAIAGMKKELDAAIKTIQDTILQAQQQVKVTP